MKPAICYLSDSTDSPSSRIYFDGGEEVWPTPRPQYPILGSTHQMLSGYSGSGLSLRQDKGRGAGRLSIVIPYLQKTRADLVENLYASWNAGERPAVHFYNGSNLWKCRWEVALNLSPLPLQIERYEATWGLIIVNEVT